MKSFELLIDKDALNDIQKANRWYEEQLPGLGERFQSQVIHQINSLKSNYLIYTIRYKNVRCMKIKKFPYLVHFRIDQENSIVEIFGVFHTSRSPKIWLKRKSSKKR